MAVTLCPVAVVAGCRRCPIFTICPLKSVIGDQAPAAPEADRPEETTPGKGASRGKRGKR